MKTSQAEGGMLFLQASLAVWLVPEEVPGNIENCQGTEPQNALSYCSGQPIHSDNCFAV